LIGKLLGGAGVR